MSQAYLPKIAKATKTRKPFGRGRWYPGKPKPSAPGTRKELASLIFDALLDGIPQAEVESKIHAAALSPAEATNAIAKYRLSAGTGKVVAM
jgi:hypothetical protein